MLIFNSANSFRINSLLEDKKLFCAVVVSFEEELNILILLLMRYDVTETLHERNHEIWKKIFNH